MPNMPFICRGRPRVAPLFLRYNVTEDYYSIANAAGNFPKIKIDARGSRDPTFITREIVTRPDRRARARARTAIVVFPLS